MSSAALHRHAPPLSDEEYYRQAAQIRQQTIAVTEQLAQPLGLRRIQDLFRENAPRLYPWVEERRVPAPNHRAKRELRPTVIARQTGFGSRSEAGAKRREILRSLVPTLALRVGDPEARFQSALDPLARDPTPDLVALRFQIASS